jgi:hypothetical protein
MKCPRCWTDKACLRPVSRTKRLLLRAVLLVPMKCQHCYHKFVVSWFSTVGKAIHPPMLRIAPTSGTAGLSGATRPLTPSREPSRRPALKVRGRRSTRG